MGSLILSSDINLHVSVSADVASLVADWLAHKSGWIIHIQRTAGKVDLEMIVVLLTLRFSVNTLNRCSS